MYSMKNRLLLLVLSTVNAQTYQYTANYRTAGCSLNPVSLVATPVTTCKITSTQCALSNQTYEYSTSFCSNTAPATYATQMFGGFHYAGYVDYADAACATNPTSYVYSLADNSCVNIDSQTSVQWWLIAANQVAMYNYDTVNCSDTAILVTTFTTGTCVAYSDGTYVRFSSANYGGLGTSSTSSASKTIVPTAAPAAPEKNSGYGLASTSFLVLVIAYCIALFAQ